MLVVVQVKNESLLVNGNIVDVDCCDNCQLYLCIHKHFRPRYCNRAVVYFGHYRDAWLMHNQLISLIAYSYNVMRWTCLWLAIQFPWLSWLMEVMLPLGARLTAT